MPGMVTEPKGEDERGELHAVLPNWRLSKKGGEPSVQRAVRIHEDEEKKKTSWQRGSVTTIKCIERCV